MATKISKREALDWLTQHPDSAGECDGCHKDGKLWTLPQTLDNEPEAGWLYCKACFKAIVSKGAK